MQFVSDCLQVRKVRLLLQGDRKSVAQVVKVGLKPRRALISLHIAIVILRLQLLERRFQLIDVLIGLHRALVLDFVAVSFELQDSLNILN